MKHFLRNFKFFHVIVFFTVLFVFTFYIYFPAFSTYFSQDDFIHLSYSDSIQKTLNAFNIFSKGDFPFYRPIPTQLYFFTLRTLFGLSPLPYHILNFGLLLANGVLVFRFSYLLFKKTKAGLITSLIYLVNSTHVASIYSPAYCHELFYVFFALLCVYFFVCKKIVFSLIFFMLALMSKETAVIIPGILTITQWYRYGLKAKNYKTVIWFILLLGVYITCHSIFYGFASSPSYKLIIGKESIQILVWYFLWALSVPNILIDFIQPGFRIGNIFFQVSGIHGFIFFISFGIFSLLVTGATIFFLHKRKKLINTFFYCLLWFIIGLIPLIVFPLHKLATQQAFSLVGLSIFLGILIENMLSSKRVVIQILSFLLIIFYLVHATNTFQIAQNTHWIILSAKRAEGLLSSLKMNYPSISDDTVIYFRNGVVKIPEYGSSKQIYMALGNGKAINIIYNNPHIVSYYEDVNNIPEYILNSKKVIEIDSSQFLGY